MIIKERKYDKCKSCRTQKFVSEEEYGCDNCRKKLTGSGNALRLTALSSPGDARSTDYTYCSWACVFAGLKKIKSDYFVSLPYLSFDYHPKGQTVKDFWKAIKAIK